MDFVSNGVDPRSTNSGELIHEHGLSSERVSSRKNDRSAGRQSSSFSQGEETSSRDGFESSGDEDADANDDDDVRGLTYRWGLRVFFTTGGDRQGTETWEEWIIYELRVVKTSVFWLLEI